MNQNENWQSEFPFISQRMRMGAFDYHYVDEGSGPPILMVHGNPTWSFYWRHLISQFRDSHRTIAVDNIGCGRSDKPQNYDYSLATHVRNLVELIERLDLRDITLVGHDWGGAIGLGAAVSHPDRFSRFVMFNTAVNSILRESQASAPRKVALRGLNLFSLAALQMAVERPGELSDRFVEGVLAPYDSWANRVAVHGFVKDIP
ncbi:alpha/beta fold hydrolase, partial [Planctomycetota bacterium]